jgi:thiol:disulfide interchange protein DsbD
LFAQILEPVKWKFENHINGDELLITYTATIDEGWHLYDQNLPANGPISTRFIIENAENVEVNNLVTCEQNPIEKKEEMFNMILRWYEKKVVFKQKMKTTSKDYYAINGYVEFMACDNANCLPPTKIPFSIKKEDETAMPAQTTTPPQEKKKNVEKEKQASPASPFSFQSVGNKDKKDIEPSSTTALPQTWEPVIDDLKQFEKGTGGLWTIFWLGLLGGLLAIATPCVWPIIPMTVSFFLHKKDGSGKRSAIIYGLSIIIIYVGLGALLTTLFGAKVLNDLSTNNIFNLFLFFMLVAFAISFFGGFDLSLPSSWSSTLENKADNAKGLLSILFMASTLVIVSFSCTGPLIGTLLVHIGTDGNYLAPLIGMLGFSIALAGPFTLFALFPNVMKKMPKSGSWLNTVKILLGFFELAFALKFLSVADLSYGWRILDREVFLTLWIAIAIFAGLYIIGKIKFEGDEEVTHLTIPRLFGGLAMFSFALYLLPGLWGAPLKSISAFAPPLWTQDFNLYQGGTVATYHDYDEAMEEAKKSGKPLLVDFSGYGCVNCREMEASVWEEPQVKSLIQKEFVFVSLYTDDRAKLSNPMFVKENDKELKLTEIGEKWGFLQRYKFGANAQPYYVILDSNGKPHNNAYTYDKNAENFKKFLEQGLKNYNQ